MQEQMVKEQIEARGVCSPRVLDALRQVPRHLFLPPELEGAAYEDGAQPIGEGQTISQPYIVGRMTELLDPEPTARILEIGTGSGYQAAVLSLLVRHVYSMEIVEPLADAARCRLKRLGFGNVTTCLGNGYGGWASESPFDGVIVTAAPDHIPGSLVDQLAMGCRMVIPVGGKNQDLMLLEKDREGIRTKQVIPVRFVPMTGETKRRWVGE